MSDYLSNVRPHLHANSFGLPVGGRCLKLGSPRLPRTFAHRDDDSRRTRGVMTSADRDHADEQVCDADTVSLRALTVHYTVKKASDGAAVMVSRQIYGPRAAAETFLALLNDEPAEVFGLLCVSVKRRVIAYHEVSRGALDATTVHPREVFKAALLANAFGIIVGHNHPSGDPEPSAGDIVLTRRLVAAGELIGIPLFDHIVVSDGRYVSFLETGRLPTNREVSAVSMARDRVS
jgi:DNA repair protein RadC